MASAVYGRHSISAGAFGYDTDGWRDNNDLRHSIQSVYYQGAITPEFNLQAEFRRRDTNEGDLDFDFDPDDFSRTEERDFNQYTGRVGARFSPDPSSDFLVSLSYTHLKDKLTDNQPTPVGDQRFFGDARDQGYQAEGQYIYRQERFNLVSGGGYSYVDSNQDLFFSLGDDVFVDTEDSVNDHFGNVYSYGTFDLTDRITGTLGLGYSDFDSDPVDTQRVNPKLGVQWAVTDRVTLRAAAFQVVRPPLTTNQTLEPTQVAGFNQFFDDDNGTASQRLGIGSDWKLADNLFAGAEATWRFLDDAVSGRQRPARPSRPTGASRPTAST